MIKNALACIWRACREILFYLISFFSFFILSWIFVFLTLSSSLIQVRADTIYEGTSSKYCSHIPVFSTLYTVLNLQIANLYVFEYTLLISCTTKSKKPVKNRYIYFSFRFKSFLKFVSKN